MLVTCPECKGQVSDDARACPHCGATRLRRLSVGRILLGVVIGFALLYWWGHDKTYTTPEGEVRVIGT